MQYFKFQLGGSGLLPKGWQAQLMVMSQASSDLILLDGKHPTSLDPKGEILPSFVVPGSIVKEQAFWLYHLYTDFIRNLVSACYGMPCVPGNDIDTSLSLSSIRGEGARYELHVDSNPITALLFVSDLPNECGGQLALHFPEGIEKIEARSGTLLIFRGGQIPHEVLPLNGNIIRVSVPMNFYPKGVEQKIWTQK